MRHQELENEAHHALRRITRSIDNKLQLQVQDGPSPQDPFVTLAISQGSLQASMEVSVEEIRRAVENARDRSLLRERIKRTRARMWFPAKPERFCSTRAIRPGSEGLAHMRQSGGRR